MTVAVCVIAGILIVGHTVTWYWLAAIHAELRRHRQLAQAMTAPTWNISTKETKPAKLPGE